VHFNSGTQVFDDLETAATAAIDAAIEQAKTQAQIAGAKNIVVEHERIDNIVDNAGDKVFFESRIIATAIGRPNTITD